MADPGVGMQTTAIVARVIVLGVCSGLALSACSAPTQVSQASPQTPSTQASPVTTPSADMALASPSATPVASDDAAIADAPTPQRVVACRLAERAAKASPEPLVIRRNGKTNRRPDWKELKAYQRALDAAHELTKVEPSLQGMETYFTGQHAIRFMAAAGEAAFLRGEVFKVEQGLPSLLDDVDNGAALDSACAAVGSVTSFAP